MSGAVTKLFLLKSLCLINAPKIYHGSISAIYFMWVPPFGMPTKYSTNRNVRLQNPILYDSVKVEVRWSRYGGF